MTEQKPIGRNRQKSARSVQPQAQQELAENLQTIAGMIELEVAAERQLDAREELAAMPDMDEEIAEIARRAADVERPRSSLPDHVIEEIATRVVLKLAPLMGQQMADIVAAMDRWFVTLHDRLAESGILLDYAETPSESFARSAAEEPPAPNSKTSQAERKAEPVQEAKAPPILPAVEMAKTVVLASAVATTDLKAGWDGWVGYGRVDLKSDGIVEIKQDKNPAGVVSPLFDISEGGLYRAKVTLLAAPPAGARLRLRVTDPYEEWMGPEAEITAKEAEFYCFVPHRIRSLKLYVVSVGPKSGLTFALDTAKLEKVDAETYFLHHRQGRAASVIASMASIPSRRAMMRDTVESLLLQCDVVRVFLNEYPDVPSFLNHPRVEYRRSQDWDDKGDAGKFGWIDEADAPGYRVIVDDDLLFPPDFVRHMAATLAKYDDHAIGGLHGVLLKQPVTNYYDPSSRSALHFQSAMKTDKTVHVLGTNAVVYHSSCVTLRWDDFMFRNMADIFLARYSQEHRVPMIAINRPWRWVRQNTQAQPFETIYENSLKRSRSKFDSSLVQDSVVKYIAPLTLQPTMRPKVALCILATSISGLKDTLTSWQSSLAADVDWVIMVAAAVENDALRDYIGELQCVAELHVFHNKQTTSAERVSTMLQLAAQLDTTMIAVAFDSVRFEKSDWISGALAHFHQRKFIGPSMLNFAVTAGKVVPAATYASDKPLPVLSLFDPSLLEGGAPPDTALTSPADVLRNFLARASAMAVSQTDGSEVAGIVAALGENESDFARHALVRPSAAPERLSPALALSGINGFVGRSVVINLDRRPDRWEKVSEGLARAGVAAERFRAVDGRWEEVAAEYEAYCASPLVTVGQTIRKIQTSREYYFDYDSQRARVTYIEQNSQKKAIASAGAWAYLKTWEQILEEALANRTSSILVFDDDVVFHKDFAHVFDAAVAELPDDWLILQLGTLQYHWEGNWAVPAGDHLYRTNGSAVGSHAVCLRLDVIPFVLDHVKRMELPFDTGALAAATRAFAEQCFVITPNIAIQRLGDSDINSSDFQQSRKREEAMRVYRWTEADYHF